MEIMFTEDTLEELAKSVAQAQYDKLAKKGEYLSASSVKDSLAQMIIHRAKKLGTITYSK
jgi:hypothetical protein